MSTSIETTDTIDAILGVDASSPIGQLRAKKPELAQQLQDYYLSIFAPTPESAAQLSLHDRALVAVRVAAHTNSQAIEAWYAELARANGATAGEIERVGDLTNAWSEPTQFGAAIQHADLLTTAPSSATAADLQRLKDAGFTPAGILSLSQTIAFVSYQLRLIAALRALGASA
jgi:uncharacterized protein YciW